MAVSFVAASTVVTGANPTVTVPSGYAQGDLLVIVTTGTATPTTPAGWTQRSAQAATGFITLLYKFAGGTEASVAVTLAGTTSKAVMLAYRGASAIDTVSGFTTATAATSVATGLTGNAFANELEVSIFVGNNVAGTWTAPALTTSRVNSSPTTAVNGMLIVDETQAAAGNSTSRTGTITAAHTLSAVAFSIIPSGRYWVGGTGTWSTATTNWAFTSGGASGAPAPTAQDPVFFDQAGTYTVTLTGALTCFGMTQTAGTVTFSSTGTITNSGSMSLNSGNFATIWNATGLLTFNSTSTGRTITVNATIDFGIPITFDGVGGSWTLGSIFGTTASGGYTTTLTNGTLNLNGFTYNTGIFSSNNINTRAIAFGTGNIVLWSTGTILDMATATNFTYTGTGGFTRNQLNGIATVTFGTTGGTTTNAPNLSVFAGSAAALTITTTSYFKNVDFTGSTCSVIGTYNACGNLTLTAGGTYTSLRPTFLATGTISSNSNTTLASLTINGTGITTTLGDTLTMSATSTTTLTAGTLALNGFDLTTGIFSSNNSNTRVITFGSNNIVLAHTTAAQTVLSMADATNFTYTGTGGFISDASITRTYTFGTTSGTSANSPNLSLTGSGTAVQTFTTGSWFGLLNFGTTAFNPGTTSLNLDALTLSSGGTFTGLTVTMVGTGTITSNGTTIAALTITTGTTTLGDALTTVNTGTTTFTAGTLVLNGFNLTTGIFSSINTNARVITFDSNFIYLVHPTAAQTVLNMTGSTTFNWSGTGGFSTAMTVTRSFTNSGFMNQTNGGVNLFITSGSAAVTFNSCNLNILDFTGSTSSVTATGLIASTLILATGGDYSALTLTMYGTGTLNTNGKLLNLISFGGQGTYWNGSTYTTLANPVSCGDWNIESPSITINFAFYTVTCSSGFNFRSTAVGTATSLLNLGTINCSTFDTSSGSFTFSQGTINATSYAQISGDSFTYNVGATLNTPVFRQNTASTTVTLNQALTLSTSYTLTQGTLILNVNLITTAFLMTGSFNTRSITFNSNQITLTGNNTTIWDGGGSGITFNDTPKIVSNYTGSVGTRTINVGIGWTEANAIDVKTGSTAGISIGTSATDTVAISGNIKVFDLTGLSCTYAAGTMTVYNNYIIPATGGTIAASDNTTTFGTTSTQNITISRSIDFPITFSGVGGTFNLSTNITVGTTRTTTLTSGTLALNGLYTLTTGLFNSSGTLARTLSFGTNAITITGTGTVWNTITVTNLTVSGTPTVNVTNATATAITINSGPCSEAQSINFNFTAGTYALTFLGTAGYTARDVNFTGFAGTLNAIQNCTIYGNYTLSSGMTVTASGTSVLTFAATSGTKTITSNGKSMPRIIINGVGGTFNLGSNLNIAGTGSVGLDINGGTFNTNNYNMSGLVSFNSYTNIVNTRVINLGSSTVTANSFATFRFNTTNLTFNAGTSTIVFTSNINTLQVDTGNLTFYNVIFNSITTNGTQRLTGSITFNNLTGPTSTRSRNSNFIITNNIVVNGTFTMPAPSATNNGCLVCSATLGSQVTITASAVSLNTCNFRDINAQGASISWTGTSLGNLGNNTNITFAAGKTVYWNLAAGGNWNSVAWALTSGGTPSATNYPLPQDTCIIENTGLNTNAIINFVNDFITTLDMSTRTNAFSLNFPNGASIDVMGNWINGSGTNITKDLSGLGINFINNSGGTQDITSAGKLFPVPISVASIGTVRLLDNFDQDSTGSQPTFQLTKGTLNLNNFNLSTALFSSNNANTRSINFGTGYIYLTNTTAATTVLSMDTVTNFTCTGNGGFSAAMSVTRTFTFGTTGGSSSNCPSLFLTSGSSTPTFGTNNYFNKLDFTGSTCSTDIVTLNLNSLTLTTSINSNLNVIIVGSGTIIGNGATMGTLTCSTGVTTMSGTLSVSSVTINGATFTLPTGSLITVSEFTLTTGTVNFNGGNVSANFLQSAGAVNINVTTTLAVNSTYTLTAGTLTLADGVTLTTGIFRSDNTNTRSIAFGSTSAGNINLAHTIDNTEVLFLNDLTGFTYTGPGGFTVAPMTITRSFSVGNSLSGPGTSATAPNLTFTTGASVASIFTNAWFNKLDFGTTTFTLPAATINANSITLSSGGTYTGLVLNVIGSGTLTYNGKTTAAVTLLNGTTTIAGTLACTTFTINGPTLNLTSGTINPSTSFVLTAGSFSLNGGSLGATPTFTHTSGSVTFNSSYALTVTGTYTLTAGTLTLADGVTLTTGIFSSNNSNTRSIAFGSTSAGNINLTHTTAATVVLSMADLTGFTYTGSGGFTVATMTNTRTFTVGTTGGTSLIAPSLTFTTGASIATITTAGWFNKLDYGTTSFTQAASTLNVNSITLSSSGTYTALILNIQGTGTLTYNGKSTGAVTLLAGTLTIIDATCTTFTVNGPTFNFTSGTLNPTTSFVLTSGGFTLNGGTLGATPTFTHTSGSVTFNSSYALTVTGTYTLTAGTLTLAD